MFYLTDTHSKFCFLLFVFKSVLCAAACLHVESKSELPTFETWWCLDLIAIEDFFSAAI